MNQTPMPLYVGTKQLYAQPMTLGDYNAYRGWTMPEGEDPAAPGYLVEYVDGGKANDSRHAGYISWSPADVFERTYKPVPADWRDHVLQERAELAAKLDKLTEFLADPKGFVGNAADLDLLRAQAEAMTDYRAILDERIARFPGSPT